MFLVAVKCGNLRHLILGQLEVKYGDVLLHVVGIA